MGRPLWGALPRNAAPRGREATFVPRRGDHSGWRVCLLAAGRTSARDLVASTSERHTPRRTHSGARVGDDIAMAYNQLRTATTGCKPRQSPTVSATIAALEKHHSRGTAQFRRFEPGSFGGTPLVARPSGGRTSRVPGHAGLARRGGNGWATNGIALARLASIARAHLPRRALFPIQ